MSVERTLSRLDVNLLTTALIIAAIGCMLVYSATHGSPDAPLFRKQVLWSLIGIALMLLFIAVDYHALMEISPFLYALGMCLLAYLLVFGRLTRNVRSWIHMGGFQFQPSEFMKIFTALLIAKYFDSNDRAYLNFRNFIVVMAIIGGPVFVNRVLNGGAAESAVALTALTVAIAAGAIVGGVLSALFGERPITLVGVGESLDDLRPFDPQDFARALIAG